MDKPITIGNKGDEDKTKVINNIIHFLLLRDNFLFFKTWEREMMMMMMMIGLLIVTIFYKLNSQECESQKN